MQKLTARQQQVLAFIKEYMDGNGYPPTRVDIAKTLGFKSPNAPRITCAHWHARAPLK
ncbi:hypothetical protein ULF88_19370 [Halopseudomonas pachastrellae]|nr:hypothetical protein [Halopseudomonas pachastrellae]